MMPTTPLFTEIPELKEDRDNELHPRNHSEQMLELKEKWDCIYNFIHERLKKSSGKTREDNELTR